MLGSTAKAVSPASMAGLPGKSATVSVGRPLLSSGPRSALMTVPALAEPIWLPCVPLVMPVRLSPSPIRL